MLYFFYGDQQKANEKAKALTDSLLKKKPDASLFVIDDSNLTEDLLQEMTQSSALFENKYIVRIKGVEDKEQKTLLINFLKEMKESENVFIWNEGSISKTDLKKIEKNAEKIIETRGGEKKELKRDNKIFEICDPLISRDKKRGWVKLQELLEIYPAEELHGTMFWQFKNIAIAFKTSQKDSGVAPFPYSKAKQATQNYSEDEIMEKTSELAKIVHESRSGGVELPIALERFILNL